MGYFFLDRVLIYPVLAGFQCPAAIAEPFIEVATTDKSSVVGQK